MFPVYRVTHDPGCTGQLRDELLNGDIFYTLKEAQIMIEAWRRHYDTQRSHTALHYQPPAPQTVV